MWDDFAVFRSWYATCPRGAEPALESELAALGAKGIRPGQGGARFTGERELALRACLDLRTALRVLEPVAEFPAGGPNGLGYGGERHGHRSDEARTGPMARIGPRRSCTLASTRRMVRRCRSARL